jgi:anti-sigma factor ChrR (cupin superfamily)
VKKNRIEEEDLMVGSTPSLKGQDLLDELSSRYVQIDDLPWIKGGGQGIERKILLEDKERGLLTALIRWSPGAKLAMHEHLDFEQSFVLEGSLCDHEGECKAGDYVWRPPGSRHRAWSPDGCLLLAMFMKPNKFLEGPKAEMDKNKE